MPSNFRKRLLEMAKRVKDAPGTRLRFEVPLESLRSADGFTVTGQWTASLVQDGKVVVERDGATGEDALEALELDAEYG